MNTPTFSIPVIGLDKTSASKDATSVITFAHAGVNAKLLAQSVRMYLTNKRQGTASTKDRSRISGTTKKMYKQKGTGNARHGSKKAPIFVGGGVVGGPTPKTYALSMNKKQKTLALRSAFAHRLNQNEVFVFAQSAVDSVKKTKDVMQLMKSADMKKRTVVLLSNTDPVSFAQSLRNISSVKIQMVHAISPYVLLQANALVVSPSALAVLLQDAS